MSPIHAAKLISEIHEAFYHVTAGLTEGEVLAVLTNMHPEYTSRYAPAVRLALELLVSLEEFHYIGHAHCPEARLYYRNTFK